MNTCLPAPLPIRPQHRRYRTAASLAVWLAAGLLACAQPAWAQAPDWPGADQDPPAQVARLGLAEGAVRLAPADAATRGDGVWMTAPVNQPLTRGDRLWTGPDARAELHVGSTAVRMNEETRLDFAALDDSLTRLQLAQGALQLRVRTLFEGQRLEISTPNLAFVVAQPGNYRLDVDPARNTTRVVVQSGSGQVYGSNNAAMRLGSGQQARFAGTQLAPAAPGAAQADAFDYWAQDRDRLEDASVSARYVPRETTGYQQLDAHGDWLDDPQHGAVWLPRAVPANWAPYRMGHWRVIAPWGWTWIDDAPWGFAPFHYGRWAQLGPRWAWVPGRLPARPVYAPALVAFMGGSGSVDWRVSIQSGVSWFPLAPGEAYYPAYRASPRHLRQVNHHIVVHNGPRTQPVYQHQRLPAALTVARDDRFFRGRPPLGSPHTERGYAPGYRHDARPHPGAHRSPEQELSVGQRAMRELAERQEQARRQQATQQQRMQLERAQQERQRARQQEQQNAQNQAQIGQRAMRELAVRQEQARQQQVIEPPRVQPERARTEPRGEQAQARRAARQAENDAQRGNGRSPQDGSRRPREP